MMLLYEHSQLQGGKEIQKWLAMDCMPSQAARNT